VDVLRDKNNSFVELFRGLRCLEGMGDVAGTKLDVTRNDVHLLCGLIEIEWHERRIFGIEVFEHERSFLDDLDIRNFQRRLSHLFG
jgi:hypothetical protein